jgi:hypothetical protein
MEQHTSSAADLPPGAPAKKGRRSKRDDGHGDDGKKRRCISSACVPCRKRKSKVRNANCLSPADGRNVSASRG